MRQFLKSPGGSTPKFSRSRPELPAVVADRDDGADVVGVLLQPAKEHRHAGASPDCDDTRAARAVATGVQRIGKRVDARRCQDQVSDGAIQAVDGHDHRGNAHAAEQDALEVPGKEVGQVDVEYVLG